MRRNDNSGYRLDARPALVSVLPVVLFGLCLVLAGLCSFAPGVRAAPPRWIALAGVERVTFYGPHYVAGDITASGIRYAPDNDTIALGPELLDAVRGHYARLAGELGQPLAWGRTPDGHIISQGIAGAFAVPISWRQVAWWGHRVRVCAQKSGGGELCRELRVADTGRPELQVDLPDATWRRWGWPEGKGFFAGRLEVLDE